MECSAEWTSERLMWMELGKIWKIYKGNVRGPGMVVRNSFGEFIAARTCFLGGAGSALCAEALAWRAAMDFALGLDSIVMEGDSHHLVGILAREAACPTGVEVIVERYSTGSG